MIKRYVVVSILLFAGLLPAGNAGAKALPIVDVNCGGTVTKSLRLQENIAFCDVGIVISKSNITLDLNGFSILGNPAIPPPTAIRFAPVVSNVTIRNGAIKTWQTGIDATEDNHHIRVEDMLISKAGRGIAIIGKAGTIDNVTFNDNGVMGVYMGGDDDHRVLNSTFYSVGNNTEEAVLIQSDDAVVDNNVVVDSDEMQVEGSRARVTNNDVLSAALEVIGQGSHVSGNDVARNGLLRVDGVGGKVTVTGNTAHDGIASGMNVIDTSETVARNNYAYGTLVNCAPSTVCNQTESSLPVIDLECGDEVTQSMRLAENIGPCSGDGLTITKSNITLDLDHHHIEGNGASNKAGIRFSGKNIKVRNGYISSFERGVTSPSAPRADVRNIYARDTDHAVDILGANARVTNVTASESHPAALVGAIALRWPAAGGRIDDVLVSDAAGGTGIGIYLGGKKGKVSDATVADAMTGIYTYVEGGTLSNSTAVAITTGFEIELKNLTLSNNEALGATYRGFFASFGNFKLLGNDAYASERGFGLECVAGKLTFKKNRSFLNAQSDRFPEDSCS